MASHQARKHHAVALPLPAQGHLNGLMRLCKKLASHGFTITFVDIDPIHHRIQELQEEAAAASSRDADQKLALDIRRAHVPIHGLDLSNAFRFSFEHFFEALQGLVPRLEKFLHHLISTADPPITCLISDFHMPSDTLAHKFNLPRIVYYPFSASMLLFMVYVLHGKLSLNEVVGAVKKEEKGVFHRGLMGLPTINYQDLPTFKHLVDNNEYFYGITMRDLQESEKGGHAFVVNTFKEAEEEALKEVARNIKLPVYSVGPLVETLQEVESVTSLWKEDEECMKWLDQQAPLSVLYISFGSVTFFSHLQFEEFVAGLLSSKYHFLFVLRLDLVEQNPSSSISSPLELLLSNGKGYIVEWTSQLSVLSHPSVGGFLTHCGHNSVMEALFHGVPMLCWPYFADQFMNAKFIVEEWKVGLRFCTDNESQVSFFTRDVIEKGIKALMEGEDGKSIRKNAERFKEASCKSLSLDGTSHRNFQGLIKSL